MEINNSYSQNSYQSQTSSTKKVDEVNSGGILNTFERLIDKANRNNTDNVKTSAAYYESSNIPSTSSVTYEKPTLVITPPPNNLKNQQAYFTLGC